MFFGEGDQPRPIARGEAGPSAPPPKKKAVPLLSVVTKDLRLENHDPGIEDYENELLSPSWIEPHCD